MKLFTIGPVEMYPKTLEIRAKQVPYFRNQSFSRVVLESSEMLKSLLDAPAESECIMLTCSGTGGMEATVMNCLGINDRALVIDGGSFGNRFCRRTGFPTIELRCLRERRSAPISWMLPMVAAIRPFW